MTNALVTSGIDPDVSAALQIFERLRPVKEALGIEKLTDGEMQVFAMVALHTGLDPFTKQIYAIKRGGKVTHQTGIDGYRSTAERMTGQYAGSDEATYEECGCGADDSPPSHPKLARVVVHRILPNGHIVNQVGVARWHELKPAHTKGQYATDFQDSMWWRQPYNQLAKCAEANGLRKAFPRVLGGVYISEEMEQAGTTIEGTATETTQPATVRERVAAKRLAAETTASTEAVAEPADAPDVAAGGQDEPPAAALTREAFLAGIEHAGIALEYAEARSKALFPGVAGKALTDEQRAELFADLTTPETLPFLVDEAEIDAAVAAI